MADTSPLASDTGPRRAAAPVAAGADPAAEPPAAAWLPAFAAASLIWGASFLFIGVGVREIHPLYLTLARVGVGALVVLGILRVTGGRLPRDARTWGHLAFVGVLGAVVPYSLFGYGEQRVSSVLAGIWNATTPLVALPLAVLLYRTERFSARRAAGLLIGFAGVLTVLGVWRGLGGSALTGQLMCLAAAACYGVVIGYQRRFLAHVPGGALAVPAGMLLCASAVLAVAAPLVAGAPPAPSRLSLAAVGSVLALGALGTGLALVLHYRVIMVAGASTGAAVTYAIPVVSTLLGALVLGEQVQWNQPVGGLVVLLGVAVSQNMLFRRR